MSKDYLKHINREPPQSSFEKYRAKHDAGKRIRKENTEEPPKTEKTEESKGSSTAESIMTEGVDEEK